jgi:hypothetical protein
MPLPRRQIVGEWLYHIACPHCGSTIALLETSLVKIVRDRRESTTGEPFLTLVCPECKAAFRYDYQHRSTVALIDEGPQTTKLRSQIRFSISAGCDVSNCESRVELIAVRSAQTTRDMCIEEVPSWNLRGLTCANGPPFSSSGPKGI